MRDIDGRHRCIASTSGMRRRIRVGVLVKAQVWWRLGVNMGKRNQREGAPVRYIVGWWRRLKSERPLDRWM